MAAYRWVDDLVTCGLTACTQRSAPGPTLGNEYWKPLPFYIHYSSPAFTELILDSLLFAFDIGWIT